MSTSTIPDTTTIHALRPPATGPELPICPNGCGPLHFAPDWAAANAITGCGKVHCPLCHWEVGLYPAEARTLEVMLQGGGTDSTPELVLLAAGRRELRAMGEE